MTIVELIAAIVSSAIGIFFGALLVIPDFRRWLKGSRTTYYFQRQTNLKGLKSKVYQTSAKLRTDNDLQDFCHHNGYDVVGLRLELNQGVFRQRSAIYGGGLWAILRYYHGGFFNRVFLKDEEGLIEEDTLQFINTYPSLQAVLNRIEELEKQLVRAEDRRQEWFAALEALRRIIESDRQRYRSSAAGTIRSYIGSVQRAAKSEGEPEPHKEKVNSWIDSLPILSTEWFKKLV